ncbi:Photosystem I assembly protein Ycf3 [uncultured archaeon]|nr:Photosystem I assembly protein Ycf3 [uncultured archaeon]
MNSKEKVLIHRGMDKVRRMEYEAALEIFDRVLAMNSQIPEAWNDKGVALFRLGRAEEAIACYDQSLTLDPENLDALRNKGLVLRSLGDLEGALQAYDSVLQKGGDAVDMESMAAVLAALGRLEEALSCLFQALQTGQKERIEAEIDVLKGMILQRDGPVPQGKE